MIRLLLLCRYFDKLHARRGGTLQYYDGRVDENEFINHLLNERHLGKDIRETIKGWIYRLTGYWILQGGKGYHRMQKRRRMIYDLLREAKRRDLLLEIIEGNTKKLWMDDRGRRFMGILPFLNVLSKEYSDFISTLSIILGSIGSTLLVVFWAQIIEFLATI